MLPIAFGGRREKNVMYYVITLTRDHDVIVCITSTKFCIDYILQWSIYYFHDKDITQNVFCKIVPGQ